MAVNACERLIEGQLELFVWFRADVYCLCCLHRTTPWKRQDGS